MVESKIGMFLTNTVLTIQIIWYCDSFLKVTDVERYLFDRQNIAFDT